MSYYGQGDYYGQGGLGSFLKGAARAAVGFVTGGPLGAVRALIPASRGAAVGLGAGLVAGGLSMPGGGPGDKVPGIRGTIQRILPGGETGYRKRRSMNMVNPRALARANRRVEGFVRVARRSLKHTGYKVVTKNSGSRARGRYAEHGPGDLNVRA